MRRRVHPVQSSWLCPQIRGFARVHSWFARREWAAGGERGVEGGEQVEQQAGRNRLAFTHGWAESADGAVGVRHCDYRGVGCGDGFGDGCGGGMHWAWHAGVRPVKCRCRFCTCQWGATWRFELAAQQRVGSGSAVAIAPAYRLIHDTNLTAARREWGRREGTEGSLGHDVSQGLDVSFHRRVTVCHFQCTSVFYPVFLPSTRCCPLLR